MLHSSFLFEIYCQFYGKSRLPFENMLYLSISASMMDWNA